MQFERLPCALRIHGRPVARETIPGGPILPLRNLRGIWDTVVETVFGQKGWAGPQSRELRRRLKKFGIRILLANYGPTGVALLPVARAVGIPLVVHFHGFDAHRVQVLSDYGAAYGELGRHAAAIVVVSEKMKTALQQAGVPASKLWLIRYGVEPDRFRPREQLPPDPVFFGVGRFVDKKAPYLTVLAFKKVQERLPRARLILGGDGPLAEVVRNLVKTLDLDGAVELPGVLPHERVAALLREATAFVQHSITPDFGPATGDSEGTPVAVLEAMMSGVPVIATRHAGIGEVVEHGRTGLLVEERDVEGMARAMIQIAENPEKALEMGRVARAVALENYTADHYITALKQLLESVS